MGLLDKLKGTKSKAAKLAAENEDKIDDGIDKAADFIDDRTGGKHTDKIDSAAETAKGAVDKLSES